QCGWAGGGLARWGGGVRRSPGASLGGSGPRGARLVAFAHELADISAATITPHFRRHMTVRNKAASGRAFDPVTTADRAAERAMRAHIAAHFPDHGVIGEEFGVVGAAARYRWVIDPIDGTRSFITGSPLWGTLIGLVDGGRALLGLMNQPFTGERFWSDARHLFWRGPRTETRTLTTRPCRRLSEAVLATTDPELFTAD